MVYKRRDEQLGKTKSGASRESAAVVSHGQASSANKPECKITSEGASERGTCARMYEAAITPSCNAAGELSHSTVVRARRAGARARGGGCDRVRMLTARWHEKGSAVANLQHRAWMARQSRAVTWHGIFCNRSGPPTFQMFIPFFFDLFQWRSRSRCTLLPNLLHVSTETRIFLFPPGTVRNCHLRSFVTHMTCAARKPSRPPPQFQSSQPITHPHDPGMRNAPIIACPPATWSLNVPPPPTLNNPSRFFLACAIFGCAPFRLPSSLYAQHIICPTGPYDPV